MAENGKAEAGREASASEVTIFITYNPETRQVKMGSNKVIPGPELLGILEYAKSSILRGEIMGELTALIASVARPAIVNPNTGRAAQAPAEAPAAPESALKQ